MADSGDDADSRTALIGAPRSRSYPSSARNSGDSDSRPTKRRRRNRSRANSDVTDFVPRGATFSAKPLEVDPDETSGSDLSLSEGPSDDSEEEERSNKFTTKNPHAGSTAPVINWNSGKKVPVRTTLGKRKTPAQEQSSEQPKTSQPAEQPTDKKPKEDSGSHFNDVNTFWRPGSESASEEAGDTKESGEVTSSGSEDSSEEESIEGDSDDSDSGSLSSEEDDSIMLNIGTKSDDVGDNYDPEDLNLGNGTVNHPPADKNANLAPASKGRSESKEKAFERFAQKYPTAPTTLVDLDKKDMEIQAQFIHWNRNINDIDMQLPVGCIECLQYGHLADVCPTKECKHCGVWNQHQSSSCPSWRRCQRCRERGHLEADCPSKLKGSASEIPCDLCGSPHLESQCENRWRLPLRETIPPTKEIRVSISCAYCVSSSHLIGDCPSYKDPKPPAYSLKDIDPSIIVDLNKLPKQRAQPIDYSRNGKPRKPQPPSPLSSSDDNLPRKGRKPPQAPRARGKARGGPIRFGDSFTVRNGSGPDKPRGGSGPSRGNGRPFFPPNNNNSRPPPASRPPASRGGGRGRGRGKPPPRRGK